MGKNLDRLDSLIDVNAIVFERCLDTVVGIAAKYQNTMSESSPVAEEGVFMAACRLFDVVRPAVPSEDYIKAMLEEYAVEKEEARRLALEKRKMDMERSKAHASAAGPEN